MTETPLPIIANISRVVARSVDRITGDRSDYPLLVAVAVKEALQRFGIQSQVMFGPGAWIEILEDLSVVWAGCWGENVHLWVATQFGEVVDINASVAHRRRAHDLKLKSLYSPPMIWSKDVPKFYRYRPEGVAEIELDSERDRKWLALVQEEIDRECNPSKIENQEPEFTSEPIICPGKKLLDDSRETFKHFDRALGVKGIPKAPF